MDYASKKRAGFLMLEIACALALFSIMSAMLVRAYSAVITCQMHTYHYHEAWSLAPMIVEKVRIGEWPLGTSMHYGNYEIVSYAEPYAINAITSFMKLIVKVSWQEKDKREKQTVTLYAGMINDQ